MIKPKEKQTSRPVWLSPELYPFQSRFFNYCGSMIHYLDEGDGLPIIFSHPAVGWSFMYRSLIKILRKHYRCIAIDYPGFGLSDKPGNYAFTLRSQSEALEALFNHLGLQQTIILGHDTGGASAFAFGLRRPGTVLGIILTDTVIFPVSEYPFITSVLNKMEYRFFAWINRRFNIIMQVTSRFAFKTKRLTKAERRGYLQSFDTSEKRDAVRKILLDLKQDESLMQEIHRVFKTQWQELPSLLMCGEKDKLVTEGIYDRIRKLLQKNGTAHLIPGEEHFPHEGRASLMARHIDEWMARYFASSNISNLL